MQGKQLQGNTLRYVVLEPDDYDPDRTYPLVVLLHGYGAHMGDLATLAPAIESERYVYVCPNAPMRVQLGFGSTGYAWMPLGDECSIQDVRRAEDALKGFLDEVIEHYRPEADKVLLCGFSQGGMMAYRCGLPAPDRFRGVVALSSRVLYPEDLEARLPLKRDQAIFIAHGTEDPIIPVEDGRQSRAFLENAGYAPCYKEYGMGHQITQEVLDDLTPWVHRLL